MSLHNCFIIDKPLQRYKIDYKILRANNQFELLQVGRFMGSGWLKIAAILVLVVVGIVIVVWLLGPRTEQAEPQQDKTFYDVIAEDDARLRAEPVVKQAEGTGQQAKLQFKELSEEEQAEAERLLEWAIQTRKMGRLPGVSYQQTVDTCREIIKRFGGSEYDYKARRILADIPEQYRSQYKITNEEIDLTEWPKK
jgi:hypothetical protein